MKREERAYCNTTPFIRKTCQKPENRVWLGYVLFSFIKLLLGRDSWAATVVEVLSRRHGCLSVSHPGRFCRLPTLLDARRTRRAFRFLELTRRQNPRYCETTTNCPSRTVLISNAASVSWCEASNLISFTAVPGISIFSTAVFMSTPLL